MIRFLFPCLVALATSATAQDIPFASFDRASEPVLNDPHDLALGPDGRLYIADKFAGEIAVMDPETLDIIETFGDGQLAGVHDISFGPDGRAYVAVTGLSAVAVYDFASGTPELVDILRGFSRTEGALAHSNGRLYVMASGIGVLAAIEGGEIIATAEGMPGAHDVEEGPDGTVWVADNFNRRIVQFSPALERLRVLDSPDYGFVGPRYIDLDDLGRLVVADQDAHRVLMIETLTEEVVGILGDGLPGLGPGKFDDPEGIVTDGSTYWIADSDNNRIVKYVVVVN